MSAEPTRFRVVEPEGGMLLSRLVARRLGVPHDEAIRLVKDGSVYVGRLRVRRPTARLETGDRVSVYRTSPATQTSERLSPDDLVFVHRDPEFVVIDKPPGVPVTATRESARGTLSDALLARLSAEGVVRPYVGAVHRLDQRASGLVLFTIRPALHQSLHQLFVEHEIVRDYVARVHGEPPATLRCDLPIVETGTGGARIAHPGEPRGKPATTFFERAAWTTERPSGDDTPGTLVFVRLETGRMHQVRVHAQALGFPIVGDDRYGAPREPSRPETRARLHLHAIRLRFNHPRTGVPLDLESEPPPFAVGYRVMR